MEEPLGGSTSEGRFLSCDQLQGRGIAVEVERGRPRSPVGRARLGVFVIIIIVLILWGGELSCSCLSGPIRSPLWLGIVLWPVAGRILPASSRLRGIAGLARRAQASRRPHDVGLELLVKVHLLGLLLGGRLLRHFVEGLGPSGFVSPVHIQFRGEGGGVVSVNCVPATHEKGPAHDEEEQEDEDAGNDDQQHVLPQKAHGVAQEVRLHGRGAGRRRSEVRGDVGAAQEVGGVAELFPA